MVYRRRIRNVPRKRRVFRRRPNRQIRKLAKQVRRLRPELKHSDLITTTGFPSSNAWSGSTVTHVQDEQYAFANPFYSQYLLNGLNQGSGHSQRLGWKTMSKFLDVKLKLATASEPSTSADSLDTRARSRFRVMMVMQKDFNPTFQAGAPVLGDILQYPALTSADDTAITSPYLDRFRERFVILHDRVYSPQSNKGLWINTRIKKRLRSTVSYSSDAAISASNQYATHGAIYLLVMFSYDTDEGSPAVGGALNFSSRYYYTDA